MTMEELLPKYESHEQTYPICKDPLPAHQTWPGARYCFCLKPDCISEVQNMADGRYVGYNEERCTASDCDNFIPEGRYRAQPAALTCSAECWLARRNKGTIVRTCGCGCGQDVVRRCTRKTTNGLVFVSGKHLGDFFINQYLTESCGPFRDIVDEYLIGFATLHYRNPKSVRSSLGRFCLFLNERHIDSLEKVTPATITEFIVWANKKADGNGATNTVPSISTFFKWLIAGGRRTAANPVVGLIHGQRKTRRMPRPYKEHELNFIWELLRERGNLRLRLATAIAEEAGLRIAEVCRLRTADVDVEQQRLFIRLPNKTSRERYAFFSRKTSQYYDEWMRERDSECGHDCLLYNAHGNPWTTQSLTAEFKNVLCTKFKGKKIHDTGLEVWSMHRLRHTMATNLVSGGADAATVMAAGGWVSHESMAIYAEVDPAVARHGYNEAVRRAREQREAGPRTRTLSPAEFLKLRQIGDEVEQVEDTPERCV